jgi:arylformamidase
MKIYDISMEISKDMMVYKNKEEKKPQLETTRDFTTGTAYESTITMDMHTGTHMDAPLHMIEGAETIERQDLSKVITPCKVIDLIEVEDKISKKDLKNQDIEEGDFILLKTKNSFEETFNYNFVYLDREGAEYLRDKKVIGVGIDALGIERDQPERGTHLTLMKNEIIIIEGLRLKDIKMGKYTLVAAPLKIKGAEASPLRALLIEGTIG